MKRLSILLAALLFAAAAGAYEAPKWRVVTDTANVRKTYQDGYIFQGRHYVGMNGYLKELAQGAGSAFVQDTVYTDVIFPSKTSTVYIRHATVDTITIREYVHNQEISLFDSLSWWADGTDTVKIDPTLGKRIEVEDDNVTVMAVDEAGNLTAQNLIAEKKLTVADSARNEGPLRQKGASTFGATATPAVIGADGSIAGQSLTGTETLGNELITNFAGWTPTTNWTYASSKWSHATGNATALVSDWSPTVGVNYKVVYTLAQSVAGTGVTMAIGGVSFPASTAAGSYTYKCIAPATTALRFTPGSGGTWVGDITAVSVTVISGGDASFVDGTFSGQMLGPPGNASYPTYSSTDYPMTGIFFSGNSIFLSMNGSIGLSSSVNGLTIASTSGHFDLRGGASTLYSNADNQWDFRNSTNPNILNFYNTYTSATSYERGFARATATAIEFGSEKGSAGGTARPVNFYTDGVSRGTIGIDGNWGIGTASPLHQLSLASAGGLTNALHIVNSTINKNRTTQAQSTDSASIWLGTYSTGIPALRLVGPGDTVADTLSITSESIMVNIKAKNPISIVSGSSVSFGTTSNITYDGTDLYPSSNDQKSLGKTTAKFKNLELSDNANIGGKGQTATLTVGTQDIMTEQTDSCTVITPINGSGSIKLASAAGAIMHYMGVQGPTFDASAGMSWLSPVADGTDTLWYSIDGTNATYWIGAARAVKH
jgi:hypothetical protein